MPKVMAAAPVPVRGPGTGLVAVVAGHELTAFVSAALESAGARPADADLTAEVLVAADLAGAARHGVVRLLPYVQGLLGGTINGAARPEIVRRYGDVTVIDAHHGLGQPALAFAVDQAVEQARVHGSSVVSVQHSRHVGITAWYSGRAARGGAFGVITTRAARSGGGAGALREGAVTSQFLMCLSRTAAGGARPLVLVPPAGGGVVRPRLTLPVPVLDELVRIAALVKVVPVRALDRRRPTRSECP
ncbi:Ldh family oxidoreductase [Streptomyces sp. NRRL S-448]|uniref:Ldh family oxidoreductase n=1 Tax=Streptomyces sp. NRRL S-448 TaxID=1463907 RepID=UPI00356928C9